MFICLLPSPYVHNEAERLHGLLQWLPLAQKQPYKAIYEQDWAYFDTLAYDENGIYSILINATAGYTEDQYRDYILEYYKTVTDKRFNKPYNQLVYAPMVHLFRYLQENQFEIISFQDRIPGLHGPFVKNLQAYLYKM